MFNVLEKHSVKQAVLQSIQKSLEYDYYKTPSDEELDILISDASIVDDTDQRLNRTITFLNKYCGDLGFWAGTSKKLHTRESISEFIYVFAVQHPNATVEAYKGILAKVPAIADSSQLNPLNINDSSRNSKLLVIIKNDRILLNVIRYLHRGWTTSFSFRLKYVNAMGFILACRDAIENDKPASPVFTYTPENEGPIQLNLVRNENDGWMIMLSQDAKKQTVKFKFRQPDDEPAASKFQALAWFNELEAQIKRTV